MEQDGNQMLLIFINIFFLKTCGKRRRLSSNKLFICQNQKHDIIHLVNIREIITHAIKKNNSAVCHTDRHTSCDRDHEQGKVVPSPMLPFDLGIPEGNSVI